MNKDDMTVRKSWNEFCDKNPKVCIETTKMIDTLFDVQGQSQYIYQDIQDFTITKPDKIYTHSN